MCWQVRQCNGMACQNQKNLLQATLVEGHRHNPDSNASQRIEKELIRGLLDLGSMDSYDECTIYD